MAFILLGGCCVGCIWFGLWGGKKIGDAIDNSVSPKASIFLGVIVLILALTVFNSIVSNIGLTDFAKNSNTMADQFINKQETPLSLCEDIVLIIGTPFLGIGILRGSGTPEKPVVINKKSNSQGNGGSDEENEDDSSG